MADYSLADLARITGAKRRSVQLWAEAGVIKADPHTERAGTGTHRRFSRDEAIIACIITAYSRWHMAIGALLKISVAIRNQNKRARGLVERAIRFDGEVYLTLSSWNDGWQMNIDELDESLPEDKRYNGIGYDAIGFLGRPESSSITVCLNVVLANLA